MSEDNFYVTTWAETVSEEEANGRLGTIELRELPEGLWANVLIAAWQHVAEGVEFTGYPTGPIWRSKPS